MIRQRSLCIINHNIKPKPTLMRNSSMKMIKMSNTSSRVTSPNAKKEQKTIKRTLSRNAFQTSKEKEKEGESRGISSKQQKGKKEERVDLKDRVINIKKDLKQLITKSISTTTKKKEAQQEYLKPAKSKVGDTSHEKISKIFAQDSLAKRHSICNLKVIKEEKHPKPKSNKSSASKSKIDHHPSKEKFKEGNQKQVKIKKEEKIIEGKGRPVFSLDSTHLTSSIQMLPKDTRGSSGKQEIPKRSQNKNFLQFFKQYRNSFDLKGVRMQAQRSKIKTFRQTNISSDVYKDIGTDKLKNSPKVPTDPQKRLQHFLDLESPIPCKDGNDSILDI